MLFLHILSSGVMTQKILVNALVLYLLDSRLRGNDKKDIETSFPSCIECGINSGGNLGSSDSIYHAIALLRYCHA